VLSSLAQGRQEQPWYSKMMFGNTGPTGIERTAGGGLLQQALEDPLTRQQREANLGRTQAGADLTKANTKLAGARLPLVQAQTEGVQASTEGTKARAGLTTTQTEGQNTANEAAKLELGDKPGQVAHRRTMREHEVIRAENDNKTTELQQARQVLENQFTNGQISGQEGLRRAQGLRNQETQLRIDALKQKMEAGPVLDLSIRYMKLSEKIAALVDKETFHYAKDKKGNLGQALESLPRYQAEVDRLRSQRRALAEQIKGHADTLPKADVDYFLAQSQQEIEANPAAANYTPSELARFAGARAMEMYAESIVGKGAFE